MKLRLGLLLGFATLAACSGSSSTNDEPGLGSDKDASASGEAATGEDGGAGFDIGPGEDTGGGGGDDATVADTGSAPVDTGPADATCATSEVVAAKPPVDVILAVDQSGSMTDGDILNVRNNVNKLSDYLKATGLDYRVVMIANVGTCAATSTTCAPICVPPPLGGPTADCDNKTKALRNSNPPIYRTSNQSVSSTNALSLVLSTYDSTVVGVGWKDAIRPESFKAIIPITDDNSSLAAAAFDTSLLAKLPAGTFGSSTDRKYAAFPIMGAAAFPSEAKCGATMVNNGPNYISLVKLTGGKWFPLCTKDFGPVFIDIAKSIASKVACEVGVPAPPPGETFDPTKVGVVYTPSSGGSVPISRDDSKPCASGANGWQYSADGKKILLCGTACAGLKADPGGKVSVQFGCAGKPPPPPPDGGTCIPFGVACGDAGACCAPLACLPGPDGFNICRAKGPA